MTNEKETNGWNEWSRYVLRELENARDERKAVLEEVQKLRTDVEVLKWRAGLWGAAAGAIPVLVAIIGRALGII